MDKGGNFNNQSERTSGLSKVSGGTEKQKQTILKNREAVFNHIKESPVQIKKTQEQVNIIEKINFYLKDFVKKYGGSFIEISPNNVIIIDEEKFKGTEYEDGLKELFSSGRALYAPNYQAVLLKNFDNNLLMANSLTHELMHFNSFQSVTLMGNELFPQRIGLEISNNKNGYNLFRYFNEAMTEQLKIIFAKEYFDRIPELSSHIEHKNNLIHILKETSQDEGVDIAYIDESGGNLIVHYNSYQEYRKQFDELLQDLSDRNKGRFPDKEDVFNLFARAYFTEDVSQIAGLIESSLGKGAFKKIAKEAGVIKK